jgi:hypothetical protein
MSLTMRFTIRTRSHIEKMLEEVKILPRTVVSMWYLEKIAMTNKVSNATHFSCTA